MRRVLMSLIAGLAVAATANAQDQAAAVSPSVQAALTWMAVVDGGDYAAGWEQAGAYLKQVVPQDQFIQALTGVRGALAANLSRQLVSSHPQTTLEGGPDGEYDVLIFASSFAQKAQADETVTVMKDPDGVWRVVGYYLR